MAMLAKLLLLAGMAAPLLGQTTPEQLAAHAQAARDAEQNGNFKTAVREDEALARALPGNAEIQSNLGVALYFDHELSRAIEAFRKATALNPGLLAPHLFSGLAYYRLSNPSAAIPELEQAVHLNPSDVIAHTWLGYAYTAQSRYDDAAKEFETACRLQPKDIDAWYALGQTWIEVGKGATVRLLTLAPDGARAWELAGEQLQLRGDRKQALEDFEQAKRRRPGIPELDKLIEAAGGSSAPPTNALQSAHAGGSYAQEDQFYRQAHGAEEESRAAFERVLELAPDSYRAHQIMADAFVTQGQDVNAIAEYRTVLRLKPDLPGAHEAIGNALLRGGKAPEALQEFEAELQLQPRSASAMTNVGQALLMTGKDDDAGKVLTGALKLHQPPPEIYRLLGKLDLQRKDYRSAVNDLNRYVSMRKDDSTAYYLLSRAYRGLGDKEQMARTLALFEKTSQDAKERSRAQRDLESVNNGHQKAAETMDAMGTPRP